MKYLIIVAILLILVGCFYEVAYYKRKRFIFDEKCNNFFIISRGLSIAGITLLAFSSILITFNL